MDKRDRPYQVSIDLHNVERVIAEPVQQRNSVTRSFCTRELMVLTEDGYQRITLYADQAAALSIEEPEEETDA